MKKLSRILILSLLIIITLSTIVLLNKNTSKNKSFETSKMISAMYQDENGAYHEGDSAKLTKDGYRFNANKSSCENGGTLSWNKTKAKIETSLATTDRCYAYFDNNKYVEDLSGNGNHTVNEKANWNEEGLSIVNSNQIINCGLSADQLSETFSIVIRFKIDNELSSDDVKYLPIFLGRNPYVSLYLMYSSEYIKPYFQVYYGSTEHASAIGESINIRQYYTIVATYNNKEIRFYNEGKQQGYGIIPKVRNVSSDLFQLSAGYTFKELIIFDRALTSDEIAKDYAGEINPTNKKDMLLWYKF